MRGNNRGLTLIEVLVAFVVLSVTLTVVLQIFHAGLRQAHLAAGYNRALFLAQSRLSALGREQALAVGESSGVVGDDLRWRMRVEPYDDDGTAERPAMIQRLYQVSVQVDWHSDGQTRQVQLVSLRLGLKP